jgi:hypothetical protein
MDTRIVAGCVELVCQNACHVGGAGDMSLGRRWRALGEQPNCDFPSEWTARPVRVLWPLRAEVTVPWLPPGAVPDHTGSHPV